MLDLRPNCEWCDKDLPADSADARICSYECTFCQNCVDSLLKNVCPNCGGGFVARPIRPKNEHRPGVCLTHQSASTKRVQAKFTEEQVRAFVATVSAIPPQER
jgi:hypothetical protein